MSSDHCSEARHLCTYSEQQRLVQPHTSKLAVMWSKAAMSWSRSGMEIPREERVVRQRLSHTHARPADPCFGSMPGRER